MKQTEDGLILGIEKRLALFLLAVAASFLTYLFLPDGCPEPARRTAFVFVLAALFWAFEIIPLFATSLLVVFSLVIALAKPDGVLGMDANGYKVFLLPFSNPVMMLFLGGFVLASAMRKHGADHLVVSKVLPVFGEKPYFILLGFILTTGFVALWMSHTAATALMLVMIKPVLEQLEAKDDFRKALVLAIPFAANVGGIGTPVGTPPNAITIGILAEHGIRIKFLSWVLMAVPLAVILLFVTSLILYFMFPPSYDRLKLQFEKVKVKTGMSVTLLIALVTIFLWLTSGWHKIPESIVALLAVCIFTAFGIVKRDDFNRIEWDILVLMWGGLALGKAMEISKLSEWIVALPLFAHSGFWLVAIFIIFTVLVSAFISNTATANLIIPIAISMPGENQAILAVLAALACSFDMVLPISTPSNALAFSTGEISAMDMFKSGFLIITIALALLLFGYPFFVGRILQIG